MGSSETYGANDLFLSCDWGTTSFRLKLADQQSDQVRGNIQSDYGIKKAYNEWKQKEDAPSRREFFLDYLERSISELEVKTNKDLRGVPLVISGMASSSLGIEEVPYASIPMAFDASRFNLKVMDPTETFPHQWILVSGICNKRDIIRGEETQLLGLASEYGLDNAACIFPGTHSKHIIIRTQKIIDFKTYMTGELFDLLSNHSILSESISVQTELVYKEAFRKGVEQSADENMLHSLFQIRASDILDKTSREENYEFLSGLLIGQELRDLRQLSIRNIVLAGGGQLQKHYAAGMKVFGLSQSVTSLTDEETRDLTLKGQRFLLNQL